MVSGILYNGEVIHDRLSWQNIFKLPTYLPTYLPTLASSIHLSCVVLDYGRRQEKREKETAKKEKNQKDSARTATQMTEKIIVDDREWFIYRIEHPAPSGQTVRLSVCR